MQRSVKVTVWLLMALYVCCKRKEKTSKRLHRGGNNFSISIIHLQCKILPASGTWPDLSWFMVQPVMSHCTRDSWLAVEVRFLSQCIVLSTQLCALKHRCVLMITPYKVTTLKLRYFFTLCSRGVWKFWLIFNRRRSRKRSSHVAST